MTPITPNNLLTAPINWSLLPKNIQKAKNDIKDYLEFYNDDREIKETVDNLIKAINKAQEATAPIKEPKTKAEPKKRSTAPKKAVKTQAKTKAKEVKVKAKKAVTKTKPVKRTAAKKKKTISLRAKLQEKGLVSLPKAPITIKKLSQELLLIKSFVGMKGKEKSVKVLNTFMKKAKDAVANCNVPSQKEILKEIQTRLRKGLGGLSGTIKVVKVDIDVTFYNKCKAAIKDAKPRMTVQYLSGLSDSTGKK